MAMSVNAAGTYTLNTPANAPKELGVLQRTDGLAAGLRELRGRLDGVVDRVIGATPSGISASEQMSAAASLNYSLTEAESILRDCIALSARLNEAI